MNIELEQHIYKLEGIAGLLNILAGSQEITGIGEEMQETMILLTEEVRHIYRALQDLQ